MFRRKQTVTVFSRTGFEQTELGDGAPTYDSGTQVIASVYPVTSELEAKEYGCMPGDMRQVLVRADTDAKLGDRLAFEDANWQVKNLLRYGHVYITLTVSREV